MYFYTYQQNLRKGMWQLLDSNQSTAKFESNVGDEKSNCCFHWKAAKQLSWAFILDPLIRNSFRMLVSSLFHWYQCVCLLQHLATLVYRLRLIETAFFCIVWQWSHFWDMWREITTVNYLMAFLFCFVEFISSMLIFCVSYWVRNCDGWL